MDNTLDSSTLSSITFNSFDSDDEGPKGFSDFPPGLGQRNDSSMRSKSSGHIGDKVKKTPHFTDEIRIRAKNFIRIFGLLYSSVEEDVRAFFKGFAVVKVYLYNFNGISDGTGYVEFENHKEVIRAIRKDGQYLGERYIKVCPIEDFECDKLLKYEKTYEAYSNIGYIRVGGLPFECSSLDVIKFFKGIQIDEIVFGEFPQKPPIFYQAVIRFFTKKDADQALSKDRHYMGDRYLQIYRVDHKFYEDFKKNKSKNIVTLGKTSPGSVAQKRNETPPKKTSQDTNDWLTKEWNDTSKYSSKVPTTDELADMLMTKSENPKIVENGHKNDMIKTTPLLTTSFSKNNGLASTPKKEVLAEPLKATLKTIQDLVSTEAFEDNFVLQTHVSNAVNLAVAIERKMKTDAETIQRQQEEIEKLKKSMDREPHHGQNGIIQASQDDHVKRLEDELKLITVSYVETYKENARLKKEIEEFQKEMREREKEMEDKFLDSLIQEARKSNEYDDGN